LVFGSIGQGVVPLIPRHIDEPVDRISIVSGDRRGWDSRPFGDNQNGLV
jgi:homospermidine synthase